MANIYHTRVEKLIVALPIVSWFVVRSQMRDVRFIRLFELAWTFEVIKSFISCCFMPTGVCSFLRIDFWSSNFSSMLSSNKRVKKGWLIGWLKNIRYLSNSNANCQYVCYVHDPNLVFLSMAGYRGSIMIFLLPAYFTNPIVRDGSGSSVVIICLSWSAYFISKDAWTLSTNKWHFYGNVIQKSQTGANWIVKNLS
jgi:hypothetical protein